MRVLFVNHTAKLGGGELALLSLLRNLKAPIKHELLLFEDGPLVELASQVTKVTVLTLPASVLNARKDSLGTFSPAIVVTLFSLAKFLWNVRKISSDDHIDVIHTNSLKADVLVGVTRLLLMRKMIVWHIRDRIAPDYLPTRVVKAMRFLARAIPSGIITNSYATLESLQLPDKRPRPKIVRVVHDGYDFDIQPGDRPSKETPPIVALVGRISRWKGQDIFLRAVAKITNAFPDVRFQIIGSPLFGEDDFQRELLALREELGLDDRVEFLGFVADIQKEMSSFSVLVHASVIQEPFGQVIIEGMAAGTAVIATRGGGASEIIQDNESGLLVPPGDVAALANSLTLLLSDSDLRDALAAAGKKRVKDSFDIQNTAAKIGDFYEALATTK